MMKIFSLEKKGMLYFSIASILMVAICLVVVYVKSQELMIDNGKERAETMLLTFEATMQNEYANSSSEDFNRKIQINLDQMKKNIPDIVEFTVYQLGDNPRGVASITPGNINKKVDPEDVAAAKKDETVVLVDKVDDSMIVDVTAPLHFGGQINYVAGAMFSLNDVMAEIKELLVFAILVGLGSLIIIGFIYWLVYIKHDIGRISSQVRKLMEISHEVSQGNLQVEVNVHSQDEVGKLEENFAKMVADMKQLIFKIKDMDEHVTNSAQEMKDALMETAKGFEQTAIAVSDLAESASSQAESSTQGGGKVQSVVSGFGEIAENTHVAENLTIKAAKLVEDGVETIGDQKINMIENKKTVGNTTEAIAALAKRSNEISSIVEVINGIAEEINLLSLNAAIEAARAGEHGRGFSVVANEVGKLADQSKKSTGEISKLIKDIQVHIENAVSETRKSENVVTAQESAVSNTAQKFEEIHAAVNEIISYMQETTRSIESLDDNAKAAGESINGIMSMIEQNAASTQELSASIEEQTSSTQDTISRVETLAHFTEDLNKLINHFKV